MRKIIEIDESLCNGCGDCVVGCAEGAIQIVGGKAKLIREDYCDGFGDCVGHCPTGALRVVEREAPAFDERATVANLRAAGGEEAVRRYEEAQARHARQPAAPAAGGGCPGSAQRVLRPASRSGTGAPPAGALPLASLGGAGAAGTRLPHGAPASAAGASSGPAANGPAAGPAASAPVLIPSELNQWPVQLHLVRPGAPFFRDRELVILSDCGPVASAEVHQRYLRGRGVAMACPKLDDTSSYAAKLGAILSDPTIPKAVVVIMEVPCCRGLTQLALQARALSGRDDLVLEEHVLALTGEIKEIRTLAG